MVEAPTLQVRNAKFEQVGPAVPRHWNGGRKAVTAFFDNLSVFFPAGERFFVASVLAHRDRVSDPKLQREVRSFCAQEGFHTREHVRYNDMLRDQGYPVDAMERRVEQLLGLVRRALPSRWQLAATCALEHLTALMGHALLSDPRILEGADPAMAALWRWHAAEENEHKAVAFEVYRADGGHWAERSAIMALASAIFWAKVVEHQVRMMRADGIATDAREWRELFTFLFVDPGGLTPLIRLYLDYYRPDFHPWELDDRALIDAWIASTTPAGTPDTNSRR